MRIKSTVLFLVVYIFAINTLVRVICTDPEEEWTLVRQMGLTGFKINRVQKFEDEETQTYTTIIEAPKGTKMDLHDSKTDIHYKILRNTSEWRQLSIDDDRSSALYEAKITMEASERLLLWISLTYGPQSLDIDFSPFVQSVEQDDFKFNDCQFQVERMDGPGWTKYKIIVRGCVCRRSFSASVGKKTSSGFEETAGVSALYFFPFHLYEGSKKDQTSSIFINRTALAQDGVKIQSLKFLIIRDPDNFSDLLTQSIFGYLLT